MPTMTESPILSIGDWNTNAEMIVDVAKLGLLPGAVFDATYGEGNFWTKWKPEFLLTNDLHKPADACWDWTEPLPADFHFVADTVVFDPPYKLNGTPTDTDRYGVHEKVTVAERIQRILAGAINCGSILPRGGTLAVKVQDQVANGQMYYQTDMVRDVLRAIGFRKEAVFHLKTNPRPQRSQVRARNNFSTLLIFQRTDLPPVRDE